MSVYVEVLIEGMLDEVWQRTQVPEQHERWDLRFSSIDYLPQTAPSDPQRFRYSTRIGFGLAVTGEGETTANAHQPNGQRTSALRYWSNDPKSLIRQGTGYWKYVPTGNGVRFLTRYDYRVRFGACGRFLDRLVFRPLMGWATAWSFDRLRLWIERGLDPAASLRLAMIHALARLAVAGVWLYQGLAPKLIAGHADELTLLADAGVPAPALAAVISGLGWGEVLMGLLTLVCFRSRWPLGITVALMVLATLTVAVHSPSFLVAAFNPISMNLAVALVAAIGLVAMHDLPSATNCLRGPPEDS